MRGYGILLLITALLMCGLPFYLVERTSPQEGVDETASAEFRVKDAHGHDQTMDPVSFTTYATLNLLPTDIPDEAVKAVAAAVYTLGMYQSAQDEPYVSVIGNYPSSYSEEHWQSVWGEDVYQEQMPRIRSLIAEVTQTPICYDGQPIMAAIHALNNGKTESAQAVWGKALPYLISVDSTADMNDPNRLITHTVSQTEASKVLQLLCGERLSSPADWFAEPQITEVGTVKSMQFGEHTLSGTEIQDAFSLPSAVFSVSVQEDQVIFTVQGNGHLVGMSLCGCVAMAQNGFTWKEIISHYYTGVTV